MAVRTFTFVEGELIHQYHGTNSHDILPDPHGNVVGLLGADSGIEFDFEYWPYEEVPSAFSAVTPYRYIGAQGYYSDIYSRVYVVARHYRAPYGRWMTVDPIWPGNLAYSYSACSPVTWVDPAGLEESKLCRKCPSVVDSVWGSVDSLLFQLWANDALPWRRRGQDQRVHSEFCKIPGSAVRSVGLRYPEMLKEQLVPNSYHLLGRAGL